MKKFFTILAVLVLMVIKAQTQNPFGNGSDGALVVNSGETVTINTERTSVEGNNYAGTKAILVNGNGGIQAGDEVLIVTVTDPETDMLQNLAGQWETRYVSLVTSNVIQLQTPLKNNYFTSNEEKHQVIKIPNFTTVNVSGTLTCPAWDGSTGGILFFRSSGTTEIALTGIVTASAKGYRGGAQYGTSHGGGQGGESFVGLGGLGGNYTSDPHGKEGAGGGGAAYAGYNGGHGLAGGGGGSTNGAAGLGSTNSGGAGGGGGGHAGSAGGAGYGTFGFGGNSYGNSNNGQNGGENYSGNGGNNYTGGGGGGGGTYGTADLARLFFGSGGGAGGKHDGYVPGFGGNGGGVLFIASQTLNNSGIVESKGGNGGNGSYPNGPGGGASGGSILLRALDMNLGNTINSSGGNGGSSYYGNPGGNGGSGRIRLDYQTLANSAAITPNPYIGQLNNIYHEPLANTPNVSGPHTVVATIIDSEGDPITSANVFYSVNGGSFTPVNMTESKTLQTFTGNIPGQAINSVITYYIAATDGTDSYTLPLNAPADLFSFTITGDAPYGLSSTDLLNGSVQISWYEPLEVTNFSQYKVYRSEQDNFVPGAYNLIASGITDTTYIDATVQDFHRYYYIVSANYNFGGTSVESFSGITQLLVNNTSQTTVKGYAFLEARNNHANIKVKFVPFSPSAVADSVYTNALGFWETHNLIPGVYSIRLSKTGFQTPLIHENLTIISDTDRGNTTLYDMGTAVSGNVSGNWSGFYSVTGDITVPAGDSLIIDAGTVIRFLGNYAFTINGYLAANGVEGDSVVFTSGPANQVQQPNQWLRLRFYDSSDDNSYLNYTKIEYANDGIYCEWCSPEFSNCLIQRQQRYGLYLSNAYGVELNNSTIRNLSDDGIQMTASYLTVSNSLISNYTNEGIFLTNYSKVTVSNTTIKNGQSGIYTDNNSEFLVDGSTISNNSQQGLFCQDMWGRGRLTNSTLNSNTRGIYFYHNSSPVVSNNLISQNSTGIEYYYNCDATVRNNEITSNSYGIVFNTSSYYCETLITGNLVANNSTDGIHKNSSGSYTDNPTITYNTIVNNGRHGLYIDRPGTEVISNNIIAENGSYGLYNVSAIETFENNNVNSNTAGAIYNLANVPTATWNFISFNPNNNATCDIYRNINEDPEFAGPDDFSLTATSKCINGGSVTVTDSDGSVSDIGAYYFDLGNPHQVFTTGYDNQQVSLAWEPVANDSLVSYKVYYKTAEAENDYTFFASTTDTAIDVSGLTNNQMYDFTVAGNYANYESPKAPAVSEKPGVTTLAYDPGSFCVLIPAGQASKDENLTVTNNGSRDLNLQFAEGDPSPSYAYFDGSGDYVNYGHQNQWHAMSALTMECWLYRQNNGHFEFMGKNYRNYQFAINSSERVYFYKGYGTINSNSYQEWQTSQYINANQWYHLAITWEGSSVKLYVNGDFVWETTNAVSSPIPDFQLYAFEFGRRAGENSYYFQGRLAEARLWNVARSAEEIAGNMYHSLLGDEEGLIGYWPLQDDFNDHSSFAVSGSPQGNVNLQTETGLPYTFFTVPQTHYTVEPGQTEVIPVTLYNRTDMTSKFFTTPLFSDDPSQPGFDLEFFVQYGETVPATPVYFTPVASTGKPYTLAITNAKIDGAAIAVGDEIGVFDGELCVGAGIYNGSYNFVITAWEADPELSMAGFTPGHNMTFRLYDTSADLETNEAVETYYIGDDTFGYGAFSALSLEASVFNIQSVAVAANQFNLVSFNLFPRYPNAWSVFGEMNGLQIVYNDMGQVLIPGYNINTIGDINFLDGFYLFSDENETISYQGTFIKPEDWDITVEAGKWNYISMLSRNPVGVTDVFAGLEDEISIVQEASGDSWIPSQGINTIGNMEPGLGYKIALSGASPITFNYPAAAKQPLASNMQDVESLKSTRGTSYFSYTETGLPYAVIVRLKQPSESPFTLVPGNEIGLFDGNLCVGAAVYEGGNQLLITAWQADEGQNLPGFTSGHTIRAQVYRDNFLNTTKHDLKKFTGGIPVYGEGSYSKVILETVPAGEEPFEIEVQPNPFKDATAVVLNLKLESLMKVNIFDYTGRLVKTLANDQLPPDTYHLRWNGTDETGKKLNPGVYFVIAETTGKVITEKVIILQ